METINYEMYCHMQKRVYPRMLPCGAELTIQKLRTGYTVYALMIFFAANGEISEIKIIDSWISSEEGVPLWKEFEERSGINAKDYPSSNNRDDWDE